MGPIEQSTSSSIVSVIATPGHTDANAQTVLGKLGITILGFVVGCILGAVLFFACPTKERDWLRAEIRRHGNQRRFLAREIGSNTAVGYPHEDGEGDADVNADVALRQRLVHPEREGNQGG